MLDIRLTPLWSVANASDNELPDVLPDEIRSVFVDDGDRDAPLYALMEKEDAGAWSAVAMVDARVSVPGTFERKRQMFGGKAQIATGASDH